MKDKELIKQEIERRIKNLEFSLENNCVEKYSKLDILGNITTLKSLLRFIDHLPEEPASDDLKEEISKWRNHYISVLENNLRIDLRDIEVTANRFAEWRKQQMMKDAVECTWGSRVTSPLMSYFPNIKCGDKVKIIVVKEEQ